jgi:hypothetical protein
VATLARAVGMGDARCHVRFPSVRVVSATLKTPGLAGLKPPTATMVPFAVATSSPTRATCSGGWVTHPLGGATNAIRSSVVRIMLSTVTRLQAAGHSPKRVWTDA